MLSSTVPAGPASPTTCPRATICMTGRLFFDTNLIVCAMDPKDPARRARSATLIREAMSRGRLVVSPQILNECYRVLVHRRRFVPPMEVGRYLSVFHPACTAPLDLETH